MTRLSRSQSAPAAWVARATASKAVADGQSYPAAARQAGRRDNDTGAAWAARFSRKGLPAVRPRHRGPSVRYGAAALQRILAEVRRPADRERDGTATWSLSTLQRASRRAGNGLARVSTSTIWKTLHAAGLSRQHSRTWCESGHRASLRHTPTSICVAARPRG